MMMILNAILQLITALCVATLHWIIAVFRFFIPNTKKNVEGEIAFISGAGSGIGKFSEMLGSGKEGLARYVKGVLDPQFEVFLLK